MLMTCFETYLSSVLLLPAASHLADVRISVLQTGMVEEVLLGIPGNTDGFLFLQIMAQNEPLVPFSLLGSQTLHQVLLPSWTLSFSLCLTWINARSKLGCL